MGICFAIGSRMLFGVTESARNMGYLPPATTQVQSTMTDSEARVAVSRLIQLLDIVEETDAGRPFRPNTITSCRVLDGAEIATLLESLKGWV